jgi:DNA-binding beta-propeller fold protein YncE/tetratricopeptide (TPR) repeat protein
VQLIRRFKPSHTRSGRAFPLVAAAALLFVFAAQGLSQAVPKAGYVAEGSFQLPGKGQPGAPDRPVALALGPDRTVHIADGDGLVFVYDSTGIYRRTYGQAELDDPLAIGITDEGESYVLDGGANLVFVFGPGGQRVRTIASKGSKAGQLSNPVDLALGPSGHVYILDAGRRGVQIFSRDGLFVRDIDLTTSVSQPVSLAVGIDGWIYIADKRTPSEVYAFPPFTQIPWVGSTPRGIAGRVNFRGAQFNEPVATAVNELGTVVVLEKRSGRLYGANASSDRLIGADDVLYGGIGTGRGSFREAVDIAFAGVDQVLTLDARLRKIERIRLTTEEGLRWRENFGFPIRVTNVAGGLPAPLLDVGYTPDGQPRFLVETRNGGVALMAVQPEVHQTVYGDSVRVYKPDLSTPLQQFSGQIGDLQEAMLTDSTVVIADSRRNRFTIFSIEAGEVLGMYGDNYQDDRKLRSPRGVAMLQDGRVVIGDTGNNQVKIFSADLASLVASYPVAKPVGVAVDPDGEIYVWNEDGTLVGRMITATQTLEPLAAGLLPGPVVAITFDHAGNLFALDEATHRITIVKAGLSEVLMQLGEEDALDRPTRIRVDREGNIYVTDEGAKRTVVYRWDVEFPPLAAFDVDYQEDAALLNWEPGPAGFLRGYEIQGADDPNGPYRVLFTTAAPPFRIDASNVPEVPPGYVRVTPVFITGVRGRGSRPLPLGYFTANRLFLQGDYPAAMEQAGEAVRLIDSGAIGAEDIVKGKLLYIAFASAYELRDFNTAVSWAQQAAQYPMPREELIQFHFRLAEIYMRVGSPPDAAQQILALVGQGPRPEYYQSQPVIDQSFRIYRGVRDAGQPEDAIEFLRLYAQSIPSSIQTLQYEYADSITVFSTRLKLGPGFQFWRNASYGQVVAFYENLLTEGGLSAEQTVIARQILGCAYFAFGRRTEAEDTFREIFGLRPDFNLSREIARLRRLYALSIYNPETERFFGNIRPGS